MWAASQQVQSVSVRVSSEQVTEQSSRCKLSVSKKTRRGVCSYIEQPRESCSGPALRPNKDFNITTAHRQCEENDTTNRTLI